LAAAFGCATPEPYDYTAFVAYRPTSILILPPLDETMELDASYAYLSTVTRPLAERGYYVFPVALVDRVLRQNGLPTPYEMHQVDPRKLREIFGADAVLYLALRDWGSSYQVIQSVTEVELTARMMDLGTGTDLWGGSTRAAVGSSDGGGGLIGMLVGAAVTQIASSVDDRSLDVARQANDQLFYDPNRGLPVGPLNPKFEASDASGARTE
jgi:hypothetical protein